MRQGRQSWTRTQTITRPADTTQYADGDGVSTATTGTILEFTGVAGGKGLGGVITGVTLHKTDQDTTSAAFDLYFFDTTVAGTGFEDNVAIAITDAEWQTCVGFVAFVAADWRNVVTGDVYNKTNLDLNYQCTDSTTSLYGVLVARDTYTPASAEVFTIRVTGEAY